MRLFATFTGLLLIMVVLWEVFETIILPRRVQRKIRITRLFYMSTWLPLSAIAPRARSTKVREEILSFYGPASLLILFAIWALGIIVGYGLLLWGLDARFSLHEGLKDNVWTDLYYSGTNFFTLGLGEVLPMSTRARVITVIQAGTGMGFIAIVIAYLPTLYAAFSQREVNISLLDARAGSPASAGELLRRHAMFGDLAFLNKLLAEWEQWSASLMESHISYPVLCHFRSQHANQSWLGAVTAILDTCSLVMAGVDGVPAWQARLTFAMCRHALVDITQVFHRLPVPLKQDRLPPEEYTQLCESLLESGLKLVDTADSRVHLKQLRDMYEPYAAAISEMLLMPLPPWQKPEGSRDNWTTSAWKAGH